MSVFAWIVLGGVAMSAIALVGSATLWLRPEQLERVVLPLVAFAAGSLMGGAFFHMLPASLAGGGDLESSLLFTVAGFVLFFALEQFLHWHHCHRAQVDCRQPMTYLILLGDALHNFLGGLGVAGVFLIDVRLGITAWLAAAAHEIPQELGDFAVLIHGGWKRGPALLFNVLSGSTFLLGSLVAWAISDALDVRALVAFAAGNFLYIAASDLVPELKTHRSVARSLLHFASFVAGLVLVHSVA